MAETSQTSGESRDEPDASPPGRDSTGIRRSRTKNGRVSRMGPLGYGGGPVLTAGLMVIGGIFAAGWGAAELMLHHDQFAAALRSGSTAHPAPASSRARETTRPSPPGVGPGRSGQATPGTGHGQQRSGQRSSSPGAGHRGWQPCSNVSVREGRTPSGTSSSHTGYSVCVIRPGDTLAKISGRTGVPLDILVRDNHIPDPNLIHLGASLRIPD